MRVFLSHSSEDRLFVNTLALDLQSRGFNVWYSEWELGVGDSLATAIQQGIQRASWLIVVLSPASVKSKWVREELNAAFARQLAEDRIYILPVLHKDCEIPVFLRDRIYADFRQDYKAALGKLLLTLTYRYHPESASPLSEEPNPNAQLELGRAVSMLMELGHTTYRMPFYSRARIVSRFPMVVESRDSHAVEGLWRGTTGRLRLSASGNRVNGEYDWLGYDYSGVLTGIVKNDVISFDWSWSISGAAGSGLFYHRASDSLTGGWWYKYEEIDAKRLVAAKALPPQHWDFIRSSTVSLSRQFITKTNDTKPESSPKQPSKHPKSTKSARSSFAFPDKNSRNKPCPCGSGKRWKNCCGH